MLQIFKPNIYRKVNVTVQSLVYLLNKYRILACFYINKNCTRKNFFTRTVMQYWNKLSAGVVESPFLKDSRPGQAKPQLT